MDENDLRGVSDAMEELRRTGTITAETLNKLSDSSKKSKEAQEKFAQGLVNAGRQVSGAMSGLAGGNGSFKSLAGSVDVAAKSFDAIASKFGIIGKGLGFIATGVAEAAKVALTQLDFLAENYNAMGSASATAVDGIEGLSRQFDALGNYSLPAFTKAVRANALGLNLFRGTAAEGAEELSKIAGALTQGQTAERFVRLGMTLDEVGDATSAYISNYARLGLLQGSTTEDLTKKTQNYIEEVDKIARLTGQTRAQQQDEQAKTQADARSRAEISLMRARGETAQANELNKLMKAFDATTNSAVRATATGIPLTKQAQSFGVFTNDQIRQTVLAVKRGEIDAVEGAARINKSLARGADSFGRQIAYAGDIFEGAAISGFDAQARELALVELRQKAEYRGLSDSEIVDKEQKRTASAANDATKKYASATLAASGANKDLQRLGMKLAIEATPAIDAFASALKSVTGYINSKFGTTSGSISSGSSDVDRIMATIRTRESSGNYGAQNPYGSASGAYQFVDSTWQNLTKKYGIGQEFGKAKLAPKEIQDAIARAYVQDILKRAGGDVSKVPLEWYTGNIQGKLNGAEIAPGHPGVAEYQSKWMGDYNKTVGPRSGYQSSSIAKPDSAGAETQAQGNQSAQNQRYADDPVYKGIVETNALLRQNNALLAKQLQATKAG